MVECLLNLYKALNLIPSLREKKKGVRCRKQILEKVISVFQLREVSITVTTEMPPYAFCDIKN